MVSQYAKNLDLLRGVGPFLMGPFVILPRAFPLHLFLCPLGGRGLGYRSVMEVDCGTRKSSVLGDVAPVTGTRRAVTHCDRACTNAQRPTPQLPSQVLRYPDRCSLSATTALSSSPSFEATSLVRARYAPQPTHTPPADPRDPSSLHQPALRTLLRAALPASPTQILRLLRG